MLWKIVGKARALERRHAVHEELFCSDCGWFLSYGYSYWGWCMKWEKETYSGKWAKYGTVKKCEGFIRDPMKYILFVSSIREKERYAWVLDYIPNKYPKRKQRHVVQAVGEDHFILMELIPKEGNIPQVCERVYIGEGHRDIIDHVNRTVRYKDLTHTARVALPSALEEIVKQREKFFLEIFNNPDERAGKMPLLMLLPLIRMKDIENIRKERQKGEFKSFEDLKRRTGLLFPEEAIARRIEVELIFRHG